MMLFLIKYFVVFATFYGKCVSDTQTSELSQQHSVRWEHQEMLFANLVNNSTSHYNIRLRPFPPKNEAVRVNISIFLYSVGSIDELRTDYTMQILYRESWFDHRLQFTPDETVQKIVGDNWHAQHIWTPTVHVVNDNDLGGRNEGKVLVQIEPNGKVLLSKRVKLRPFCKMEFYRYPMDKQQCTLEIESSILSHSDMVLAWDRDKPLDLNRKFFIAGFSLTNYSLEEIVKSYEQTVIGRSVCDGIINLWIKPKNNERHSFRTHLLDHKNGSITPRCMCSVATLHTKGNFSRIIVRFDLQREFGHFVLDIYIPSILFVVTSWLSFWVEIPAAPARVTLSMTTMLTLVTSEKAIREKLPKVSYVHALDIWNVVCTGFVFASLIEYALVNYIYHKDKRRRSTKGMKRVESAATFCSIDSDGGSSRMFAKKGEHLDPGMPNKKALSSCSLSDMQSMQSVNHMDVTCGWPLEEFKLTPQDIANGIDRKCRYIFPAGFLVFNVIYWLILWL